MNPFRFEIFTPYSPQLITGITQKSMGSFKETHSDFEKNIEKLGLGKPVMGNQTHSDIILDVNEAFEYSDLPEADAFITKQTNLLIMVKVADCQGVIIYDPQKQVLGVIHSGWKGSTKNIIGKTIQRMKEGYQCLGEDLLVAISPSLGPCCAEFTNPQKELPKFCHPFILENNHVDFWELSKEQCLEEGVKIKNIEITGICTKEDPNYFSYRQNNEARMAVFAKMIS